MSRIWILDGYNVIHKIPQFKKSLDISLETARKILIGFCQELCSQKGQVDKIYIVFDGQPRDFDFEEGEERGVRVFFSKRPEEADDKIIEILEDSEDHECWVVSEDNYVINNAKSMKARISSAKQFFKMGQPSSKKPVPSSDAKPALSPEKAQDITQEYKKYLGI